MIRLPRNVITLMALILGVGLSSQLFAGGGGPPAPTTSAEKVRFTFTADTSPAKIMPIRILEGVEIWPATDETNITHYNVYWGDVLKNKLGIALAPKLAHISATYDGKVLVHEFAPNLKMEAGAIWVLVCTENDGEEYCGKDDNMEKITDDLIGINNTLTDIKNLINANDENSCPGIEVMETCGDLVCNGIETETSCPADCSTYGEASFNYQTLCDEVQNVYHPTSVAEIQGIVNSAAANSQHIKVNGGAAKNGTTGSASDVICTDGVVISTAQINENNANFSISLETFEGQEVVNVPAGTRMYDMAEWLHARGRSIGYGHLGWRYPTVAGHIGTSAHGSSPKHSNVVSQRVVALDIIGPDGSFQTYSQGTTGVSNPDLWHSMTTHLGYFGVITGVRLAVEDTTNLQVKITFHKQNELFSNNMAGGVYEDIKDCDYGQYNWFPSENKYLRTCGTETSAAEEEGANNYLLNPFVDLSQMSLAQTMQIFQLGGCQPNSGAHEKMEYMRYNGWHLTPPLVKTISGVQRYTTNAIGPQHRMISSPLIDPGREMFQMDWELAVPHQNLQATMEYIKDFTNGSNAKARNVPAPLIGIFVRFSKSEDNALLAYTGTGGPFQDGTTVAHIEFPIFVPVNLSQAQFNDYMAPYEEMATYLINNFAARAHWAKNQHSGDLGIFDLQAQNGSYDYDNRLQRFSASVGSFDPNGMFANKYAKHIGISYPNFSYPAEW